MTEAKVKLGADKKRKDGSGSFFQQSDGSWRAQVRYYDPFTGKSRKISRRAKSRDDAREALKSLRNEAKTSRPATADTTVADYLAQYEAHTLPLLGLAPATIALQKSLIANPLTPTLGVVTLAEFDTQTAGRWQARLQSATTTKRSEGGKVRPLSTSTQRKAFYVLAKALDVAVRDRIIAANPLRELTPPREGKPTVPTTSASDFDDRILPAVKGLRIEPLVVFVGLTGCRLGEALGLRWQDVDLTAATVTFRRSGVSASETKSKKVRTAPLVPEVVKALRARRKEQREDQVKMGAGWQNTDGLVFTTQVGTAIDANNAWRDYRAVLTSKGLPTARPFHSLRHGLATRLLQRDVPMHVVSAILGHSSIKLTVDVYGHVEPVMHADALEKALGRQGG